MPDFSKRATTPELMDDRSVDFDTFRACLHDLAKVNRLTLAYRPTLTFLNRLHDEGQWPHDRPAVILDVGSGYGDMLRLVAKWARSKSLDVRLIGLDLNPWSARAAERVEGSAGIQYLSEDLFGHQGGADIVLSSLFTHHLDDASLVRFLEWQETNARIGWFINDLQRHPFSYYGFALLSNLMLWHRFVRHDGPVSISRAFSEADWSKLLAEAGVRHAEVERWFPFRAVRVTGADVTEALIVGGGPAGAATAILLAQAGRAVTLAERETGPHDKVCGEFISHEAARYLFTLGVELLGLGAVPIRRVSLAARGKPAEAALPFPALSLSRRRLDEALLDAAQRAGATVLRGRRVRGLERLGKGWLADMERGGTLHGQAVFLATGKHDLRGRRRPAGGQDDLVAFKMHWRLTPDQTRALAGRVELCLFPGGYAGLEPIEDGLANLCLLARQRDLPPNPTWPPLLATMRKACPQLDARLAGAEPCWERPLAITAIPYGHVQETSDGLWRLGDQAAVIPSFAGDGLSIALHSAHRAAQAYLAGEDALAYQQALAADLRAQVGEATRLSKLLIQPWAQGAAVTLTRLWPRLLTATATRTRIAPKALEKGLSPSSEAA